MIKLFTLLFLRTSLKNKKLFFLNIISFTASLTLFFFVALFVGREFSANQSFENHDRIYRVTTSVASKSRVDEMAITLRHVGPTLKEAFPDVENYTRIRELDGVSSLTINDKVFKINHVFEADSNFFSFFSFELIKGNKNQLFSDNTVVISTEIQDRYFKNSDPIGREIVIGDVPYFVSGVFKKAENADLNIDVVRLYDEEAELLTVFLLLDEKSDSKEFEAAIQETLLEMNDEYNQEALSLTFKLEAISDMHFSSKLFESFSTRDKNVILIIASLAVLLIVSSCFNYSNISFALAFNRIKEVSIKKISGASDKSILGHSIVEVFTVTLLSCGLAFLIIALSQNAFTSLFHVPLKFVDFFDRNTILFFVIGILAISILSGLLYYFFFLKRVDANWRNNGKININKLQKSMLILQVSISLFTLGITFFIDKQVRLVNNFNPGFTLDNIVVIDAHADTGIPQAMKYEFNQIGIEHVSYCHAGALPSAHQDLGLFRLNDASAEDEFIARELIVDWDYFRVLNIPFEEKIDEETFGRFSVVNHKAKTDQSIDSLGYDRLNIFPIKGIVKNAYLNSLYNPIEPTVFILDTARYNTVLLAVGENWDEAKAKKAAKVFHAFFPDAPFEYTFLKDNYLAMYRDDMTLNNILIVVSIAISLISLIGILSLNSLAVVKRLREFAIRKIFGASTADILAVHLMDTVYLFIFSASVSFLGIVFFLDQWLTKYAVRADVNYLEVILTELSICVVTLVVATVIMRRSLNQNPVKVLREV